LEIVWTTARHNIPRGCYTNYIPGLTTCTHHIYTKYKHLYENDPFDNKTITAGEEVTNAILAIYQSLWQVTIEDLEMARNNCKEWQLIGKLNNDHTKQTQQHCNITANQIAYQLLLKWQNTPLYKTSKAKSPYQWLYLEFHKAFLSH